MKSFKDESTYTSEDGKIKYVTFSQAKKALDSIMYEEFTKKGQSVSDAKLKVVLAPGQIPDPKKEVPEPRYDYAKILELFKKRYKPVV